MICSLVVAWILKTLKLFVIVLILFLLLVYLILRCNRLALTLANIVKDNEEVIVWLEKCLSYL